MRVRPSSLPVATLMLLVAGCSGGEPAPTAADVTPVGRPSASATETPSLQPTSSGALSGLEGTPAQTETGDPTPTPQPPQPTATTPTKAAPYVGPPRTYDEALGLFDQVSGSQKLSRFASPSGNIYCVLDSPYLPPSCELGKGAIADADACPADGPSQSVGRIEFTEAAPVPVCNSDTIREPGAPILGYGGIATWPDTTVTCAMEEFGVTCINPPTNQGFFLAKGRYQVF